MRALILALAVAAGGCSGESGRAVPIGILRPQSARVADEAMDMGLEVASRAPAGTAEVSAAAATPGGTGEIAADWSRLRYASARALTDGSLGIYLRLPAMPAGRDILDFPEEWQAVSRVARELLAVKPILSGGSLTGAPFPVPRGIASRAWSFQGRIYVLLVNTSDRELALGPQDLEPWRAMFEVRSDARQLLADCGGRRCLPARRVLWLEGRLLPHVAP